MQSLLTPEFSASLGQLRFNLETKSRAFPTVNVLNGSYIGIHNEFYNQDFFLGMPYSQPPIGDLRFRAPVPLNSTWTGFREAVNYGNICVGYGASSVPGSNRIQSSEDCLILNVIKPAIDITEPLPVIVWIHGGGLFQGSSADPRYNLSYLVHQSVLASKPIIGVSLNYRLAAFGFLWSHEVKYHGTGNLGLRDQRLALQWIQENIFAFGGNPKEVTLFGESAGGFSAGKQLLAYGGRDDGLFRAAIMESGTVAHNWPYAVGDPDEYSESLYQDLTKRTGCYEATSTLECLRALPLEVLDKAQNLSMTETFRPWIIAVDGDFMQELASSALKNGHFVHVPILLGTNTDEGTSAAPRKGIDTDAEFEATIKLARIDDETTRLLTSLYPNIDKIGIPKSYNPPPYISGLGMQYKRSAAFFGDAAMHASRRLTSVSWSKHNQKAYSYRWNIIPNGTPGYMGATHFEEIPWVFGNIDGIGYETNPFGDNEAYRDVAQQMNRMWISFVVNGDPNLHGIEGVPRWPVYDAATGVGQNFVFEGTASHHVETDDWRAEGMAFIMDRAQNQWHF